MKYLALIFYFFCAFLPAQSPPKGFFLSPTEIQTLPTSGPAWDYLKKKAGESFANPDLSDQDDEINVRVLAGALVSVRTGDLALRDKVRTAVIASAGTESGGRTLALGRELGAYVVAADLCGLPDNDREVAYKIYLRGVARKTLDGKTLIGTHRIRPNNWGTICGWSRLCVDLYLIGPAPDGASGILVAGVDIGREAKLDLTDAAKVFRGYLGDRGVYAGFTYGELSWQCNKAAPVGVNPSGCTISGHPMDGGLPEELRRAGGFTWPPPCENYVWTGLEGVLLQAWLLGRQKETLDVWTWSNNAIARAFFWLHTTAGCTAEGNDIWQPFLVNRVYGTRYPTSTPAPLSRAIIGADWWGGIAGNTPDPGPVPVNVTFTFTPANGAWTATSPGTTAGSGSTKNASLRDWCARNPAAP